MSLQINFVDDSDKYLQRIMALVEGRAIDDEPLQLEDGKKYGSKE
jgi:hypothetical protein